MRWADMGGRPLVTSSRTFAPSLDKRALFHTAAQIQRWRKEDKARWKKERRKGRAPSTYQKWVFGQEALAPGEAWARPPALQRLPSASCAATPTEGPASPPPVTPPVAAPKRGPVPTTKPPSSKPGLVGSEPPREVVPAPPTRGIAPTSTLRASAVPFAPPEAITGAAVQSKDKFMSLSTHLAPPPLATHPGTISPSPLDSATEAACVFDLAGLEAREGSPPVPGWGRGGGPGGAGAGDSGRCARAPADQGGDDGQPVPPSSKPRAEVLPSSAPEADALAGTRAPGSHQPQSQPHCRGPSAAPRPSPVGQRSRGHL